MIDFIEGTVADKTPGELVISAGGVGFLLMCSAATLAEAPAVGEKWRCYSVLNVREDAMELFGFATKHERDMFRRLCQITGIGAKTALGVLSSMPLRDLSVAIVTGDVAALSRAPGIGKKTAQRIVLELKDKVAKSVEREGLPAAPVQIGGGNLDEAMSALLVLGYSQGEAAEALASLDPALPSSELIRLALSRLGKRMLG